MTKRAPLFYAICLIGIPLLLMSCREKREKDSTVPPPEPVVKESLAPQYTEIAAFMDIALTDSTDLASVLTFKALFNQDSLAVSDEVENLKFYKRILRNGRSTTLPIFESRTSDLSLVLFTGKGYVGPIWAEVLFDRRSRKIVKIRFDHKMETEGYGSSITEAAFEDQFKGGEIRFDGNIFALTAQGKTLEGATPVDGISGATVSSAAVVQLLNTGFKNLEPYFSP